MKQCSKCGEVKPLSEFHKDKRGKDGVQGPCKICRKQIDAEYRAEHHEQIKAKKKQYDDGRREQRKQRYVEHREQENARSKRYRAEHREQLKAKSKRYYAEHREQKKQQARQYHAEHREQLNARSRRYYADHRERLKAKSNQYNAEHPEQKKKPAQRLLQYKRSSKYRGIEWSLTDEQALWLLSLPCYYGLDHEGGGIDRLDNSKGYTVENSRSCCWKHNRMKGEMNAVEFLSEVFSLTIAFFPETSFYITEVAK